MPVSLFGVQDEFLNILVAPDLLRFVGKFSIGHPFLDQAVLP